MRHTIFKQHQLALLIGLGMATATLGNVANASCSYTVTNSWGSGFTAAIRVTNHTATAVNGWQVNWAYTNNRASNAWNALLTGNSTANNTATNVGWNGRLQPGQAAEFGLQGTTNGGALETPTLTGTLCGAATASSASNASSSRQTVSSAQAISSARSSVSSAAPAPANIASLATATTSYVSAWETLRAVNDNSNPANSNDKSAGAYGNWNNPNSIQWVQYDWPQSFNLSSTQVYWFDDNGGVLTPTRAYIEYWNGSAWVNAGNVPLMKNAFNNLSLNGVTTNRLRISMLNATQSTGILEWRVAGAVQTGTNSSVAVSSAGSSAALSSRVSSSLRSSSVSSAVSSSVRSSSSSSLVSSSRAAVSSVGVSSSTASSAPAVFTPITNQYEYDGVNTTNAVYKDSNRFRLYYGLDNKRGPKGNLGLHSDADVNRMLEHMEKVYDYFVRDRGFKSPAQSVHANRPGSFKINVYSVTDIDAGGFMGYNGTAGLSYLVMRSNLLNVDSISTHEFGHGITLAEAIWIDKARTGAWWETTAEWFADAYISPLTNTTNFNVDSLHVASNLTIVHKDNLYQAWPFLNYLTNNPDNYTNLGRDAVRTMIRAHQGQETPLHSLARLVQPTPINTLIGRYRARIAYGDIGNPLVQQRVLNAQRDTNFRNRAYRNLESIGTNLYRVLEARKPQYTGSNIIPLTATGSGEINIQVTNLGNGLSDSNFTAIVAIKASNNSVRYIALANGSGSFQLAAGEESSLVVTNTPDSLYLYNAFESTSASADAIGLNYQVQILGARPRD